MNLITKVLRSVYNFFQFRNIIDSPIGLESLYRFVVAHAIGHGAGQDVGVLSGFDVHDAVAHHDNFLRGLAEKFRP